MFKLYLNRNGTFLYLSLTLPLFFPFVSPLFLSTDATCKKKRRETKKKEVEKEIKGKNYAGISNGERIFYHTSSVYRPSTFKFLVILIIEKKKRYKKRKKGRDENRKKVE